MVVLRYTKRRGLSSDHDCDASGSAGKTTTKKKKKEKTKLSKKTFNEEDDREGGGKSRSSSRKKKKTRRTTTSKKDREDSRSPAKYSKMLRSFSKESSSVGTNEFDGASDGRRSKSSRGRDAGNGGRGRRTRSMSASTTRTGSCRRRCDDHRSRSNRSSPDRGGRRRHRRDGSRDHHRHHGTFDEEERISRQHSNSNNDNSKLKRRVKSPSDRHGRRRRSTSSKKIDAHLRGDRHDDHHHRRHHRRHHHRHGRRHHSEDPSRRRSKSSRRHHRRHDHYDDDYDETSSYSSSSSCSSYSSSSTSSATYTSDDEIVRNRRDRSHSYRGKEQQQQQQKHHYQKHAYDDDDDDDDDCSVSSSSDDSSSFSTYSSSRPNVDDDLMSGITRSIDDHEHHHHRHSHDFHDDDDEEEDDEGDDQTMDLLEDNRTNKNGREGEGGDRSVDMQSSKVLLDDTTTLTGTTMERRDEDEGTCDDDDDMTEGDVTLKLQAIDTRDDGSNSGDDDEDDEDDVEDATTTSHDRVLAGDDLDKLRDIGRIVRASDLSDYSDDDSRSLASSEQAEFELFMKQELQKEKELEQGLLHLSAAKTKNVKKKWITLSKHRRKPQSRPTSTPEVTADAVLWMLGLKNDTKDYDEETAATPDEEKSDDGVTHDGSDDGAEYTGHTRSSDVSDGQDTKDEDDHTSQASRDGDQTAVTSASKETEVQDSDETTIDDGKSKSGWTWTVNLMGGASIDGSYGGLRDGEVLIANAGATVDNDTVSSGESSVLRGSDSREDLSSRDETFNDQTAAKNDGDESITAVSSTVETTHTKNTARHSSNDTVSWFGLGACCNADPSDFSTVASPAPENVLSDQGIQNDDGIQIIPDVSLRGVGATVLPPLCINSSALKRPRGAASVSRAESSESASVPRASVSEASEESGVNHLDVAESQTTGFDGPTPTTVTRSGHKRQNVEDNNISYHSNIEVSDCDSVVRQNDLGFTNIISTSTGLKERAAEDTNEFDNYTEQQSHDIAQHQSEDDGSNTMGDVEPSVCDHIQHHEPSFDDAETHLGDDTVANTEAATVFSKDTVIAHNTDDRSIGSDFFYEEQNNDGQKRKRAQLLDDYNNAELLHGHRSRMAYIQKRRAAAAAASRMAEPTAPATSRLRNRQSFFGKNSRHAKLRSAMSAHREYMYGGLKKNQPTEQERNMSKAPSQHSRLAENLYHDEHDPMKSFSTVNDDLNGTHAYSTGNSHDNTTHTMQQLQVSLKNSIMADDSMRPHNSRENTTHSMHLKNSIMADDSMRPNTEPAQTDAQKADDLIGLFQSALGAAFKDATKQSPAIDIQSVAESSPTMDRNDAPEGVFGAALAFFGVTKEELDEFESLGNRPSEPIVKKEASKVLKCTNFNPNPARLPSTDEDDSDQELEADFQKTISNVFLHEDKKQMSDHDQKNSYGLRMTNSDEAVKELSRSAREVKTANDRAGTRRSGTMISSHEQVDDIPLELKPKKIWRAFDSFSVATSTSATLNTCETRFQNIDDPSPAFETIVGDISRDDQIQRGDKSWSESGSPQQQKIPDRKVAFAQNESRAIRNQTSELSYQNALIKSEISKSGELIHQKRAELQKLKSRRAQRQHVNTDKPFRQIVSSTRLDINFLESKNSKSDRLEEETTASKKLIVDDDQNIPSASSNSDDSEDEFFDAEDEFFDAVNDFESKDQLSPLPTSVNNANRNQDEYSGWEGSSRTHHTSISSVLSLD